MRSAGPGAAHDQQAPEGLEDVNPPFSLPAPELVSHRQTHRIRVGQAPFLLRKGFSVGIKDIGRLFQLPQHPGLEAQGGSQQGKGIYLVQYTQLPVSIEPAVQGEPGKVQPRQESVGMQIDK